VSDQGSNQEHRRPIVSDYHLNLYQIADDGDPLGLDGGPVPNSQDEDNVESSLDGDFYFPTITHYTMDQRPEIMERVKTRLRENAVR
jgi:hypothetical protein